jgi:hypothetical protein
MAFSGPVVLKANFRLGVTSAASFDASDQITSIKITAAADQITVPPTGTTGKGFKKGSVAWSLELETLANDAAANDLVRVFFERLLDDDGELGFSGTMRAGAASSVNPRWAGTFVVTGMDWGGVQEALATGSQTFPLIAAPSYYFT